MQSISTHYTLGEPVFKTMLIRNFSESTKDKIELQYDESDALLIVLRIAHLKHNEVYRTLSLHNLVKVATVCDKYDTVAVCRPFVAGWVQQWLPTCSYEFIWPAWVFDHEEQFVNLVNQLRLLFTLNDLGNAECTGCQITEMMMPPRLIGKSKITTSWDIFTSHCAGQISS